MSPSWYRENKLCKVVMTRNNVFSWQRSPEFVATLYAQPYDTGDTFKFIVEGMHISINPNCSDFVGVVQDMEDNDGT